MKKGNNVKGRIRRRKITRLIVAILIAIVFLYNILYIKKINNDIYKNKLKIQYIEDRIAYLNHVASEAEKNDETIDELEEILNSIKSKLGLQEDTDE